MAQSKEHRVQGTGLRAQAQGTGEERDLYKLSDLYEGIGIMREASDRHADLYLIHCARKISLRRYFCPEKKTNSLSERLFTA
jgi:hypothetical protein